MAYMDEALRARLVELAEEIEHSTFRETKWGRRGYAEKDVDDFLDYVVDVIAGLLSMESSPHVVSVQAEPPEEIVYEEFPPSYEEPPAVPEGEVEVETVLVTSTPEPEPPPVSPEAHGGHEAAAEDAPEVTWTPPENPFRAPPEEAVLVSADDDAALEVEEDTVAWQPEAEAAPPPAEPASRPAPEVHEDALPAEEPAEAAPPAAPAPSVQPRPAGKPRTRSGGPQPPPPPWAARTG